MSIREKLADVLDPPRKWERAAASIPADPKVMNSSRGYEGATHSRRTKEWLVSRGSQDRVAQWAIHELRARSRHLARNHWVGTRAVSVVASGIVGGTGIRPSSKGVADWDEYLRDFAKPQAQVGAQKGHSLLSIQRLIARTVIESGSCIVVREWRSSRHMANRGLVAPFQLKILEPDFLDCRHDGYRKDGGLTFQGISYDNTGWPVAYHLYDEHPGSAFPHRNNLKSTRVDAENVSHIFWQERPGQTIGIPWLAPVILKSRDLDKFEDAQLMRQQMAAMFTAFLQSTTEYTGSADDDDGISLEPGTIQKLFAGENIIFPDMPDANGYGEFVTGQLRAIAACVGLSYERLSNDYSNVNFSSARMSAMVERVLETQWQHEMMIGQFCQDLDRWLEEAAPLLGRQWGSTSWTPPARELIDPSREVGAKVRLIESGLSSRDHEAQKMGRDVQDIDEERARDLRREEEKGLDSSPNNAMNLKDAADEVARHLEII